MTYTLNVIQDMLEKIPEPARTLCETAAFNHGALHHYGPGRSGSSDGEIWEGFGPQMGPNKEYKEKQEVKKTA